MELIPQKVLRLNPIKKKMKKLSRSKLRIPIFRRVILIILDGVGAGELPDASDYSDQGANTLGNLSRAFHATEGRALQIPNLENWGVGGITPMDGIRFPTWVESKGAFGKAIEVSKGKDTTSGHWELAGLILREPFKTYPEGFPSEALNRWIVENDLPGFLGNKSASGTEIIDELGEEHLRTGKPIVYTSADSVWQIAAHETTFGLERLYSICQSARRIGDELQLGRIIARPFVGNPTLGKPFQRTYHRKDLAQPPFRQTYLDVLRQFDVLTLGIGKISSIYADHGIKTSIETHGNTHGLQVLLEQLKTNSTGLIFCNLIDFDMLYGHRRDVIGFGKALEEFDTAIPAIRKMMSQDDLLIITADHGNDPTFSGSDHTREYIPLLAFSPGQKAQGPIPLGTRSSFADVGATMVHALLGEEIEELQLAGKSFLLNLGI